MREAIVKELVGAVKEMAGNGYSVTAQETTKNNGANIMLYKEYLEIAAEKMNGDFYILPSSIHELLAVPVSTAEIEKLRQMVKEVNDNEVAPEEILGYEVYRYNRETGEVEVAA